MKNLCTLFLLISLISCSAQNIVPYDSDARVFIPNSGDYYKDTNNDFNIYEGEWKWEDNGSNSELTFIFEKEVNISSSSGYNKDLLVGEYQYIENNSELANTLSRMNNPNIIGNEHKITGMNIITKYVKPHCLECEENEKRLKMDIEHDNYAYVWGTLVLQHYIEGGIEKLKVTVYDGTWLALDQNAPEDIDIPFGEYIMIKQ